MTNKPDLAALAKNAERMIVSLMQDARITDFIVETDEGRWITSKKVLSDLRALAHKEPTNEQ